MKKDYLREQSEEAAVLVGIRPWIRVLGEFVEFGLRINGPNIRVHSKSNKAHKYFSLLIYVYYIFIYLFSF